MNPSQESAQEAARIQAAAAFSTWMTENRTDTSLELEAWLAADPENRRVWERRQQTWALFDEHAAAPELLDLRQRALRDARRVGRARWNAGRWKPVALVAGLAAAVMVSGVLWYRSMPDTYVTAAGERRALTLADGSRVELDADTTLRVDVDSSSGVRELVLVKGQARFDVVSDVVRPFSVLAAGRRVVATGTVFNVDIVSNELRVTLIEGRVAVLDERTPVQVAKPAFELSPGQQLQVAAAGDAKVVKADPQRTMAWQGGKLVFDDEPLAQVVQRVNRYTNRKLTLANSQIGELRMSGVFDAGDLDTFLVTVTEYLGVEAQRTDGGFLLTRGQ